MSLSMNAEKLGARNLAEKKKGNDGLGSHTAGEVTIYKQAGSKTAL